MVSFLRGINKEPSVSAEWIYSKPIHSDVEAKLRDFLVELGNDGKILGIQVPTSFNFFFFNVYTVATEA